MDRPTEYRKLLSLAGKYGVYEDAKLNMVFLMRNFTQKNRLKLHLKISVSDPQSYECVFTGFRVTNYGVETQTTRKKVIIDI